MSVYERCQAITKKGMQCKRLVMGRYGEHGRFCAQHEKEINGL